MNGILTRLATREDCRAIAELALIAGEGIPEYFWSQSLEEGQDAVDVGALRAASETGNFSYRNASVAMVEDMVAGMVLAYRLPDEEQNPDLDAFPEFLRPVIELERCVPGSFYVNMLAVYPECRQRGLGTTLMATVDRLTVEAKCSVTSIQVFEENDGALRLYERLGYRTVDERPVVPHPCQVHGGRVFLMIKDAGS